MSEPKPIPQCFVEGCEREGGFGFHFGQQSRHACREHRADGQAWLGKAKSAGATYTTSDAASEGGNLKRQGELL